MDAPPPRPRQRLPLLPPSIPPLLAGALAQRRMSNPGPPPPPRAPAAASPSASSLSRHHSHNHAHAHRPSPAPSLAPLQRQSSRTSTSRRGGGRDAAELGLQLPEWQPDATAKSCPVCGGVFTFWNRRHHCRKCGRVVCATCSAHRITIPKAFVVRPSAPSSGDSAHEDDADDDEDSDAREVRICDQCLGPRRGSSISGSSSSSSGHGRTASTPMPVLETSRRRRQSTQGGRSVPLPYAPVHHHHHHHHTPRPPQMHLKETDYCPICACALPLLPDPSEAGREAHIAACIATASAPAAAGTESYRGRNRSGTTGGRMVVWRAGEKDTFDVNSGEKAECVICFEEFEQGVEIARLECLCRYHKKCIKDWFERKGGAECPVHAVHD